jgi:hypothetical protein
VNFFCENEGPPFIFVYLAIYASDTQVSIVFFTQKCGFLSMVFPGRRGKHFNDYVLFDFVDGAF